MDGDDYLPTIGMTPFLVTPLLTYLAKTVFAQDSSNVFGGANGKARIDSLNPSRIGLSA